MLHVLRENPLLVLFLVAAVGFLVGRIEVGGFSLGVAAVLFVGLAAGALDPALGLPEIVHLFGLVLFVYSIGLSSGPGFFASFRRRGLRDNALAVGALTAGAAGMAAAGAALGLRGPSVAGAFTGAFTNTPALASLLETMKARAAAGATPDSAPVVAYSVTYPMGVIGVLGAMWIARRLQARGAPDDAAPDSRAPVRTLENVTVRVGAATTATAARDTFRERGLPVIFGRMKRGEATSLVGGDTSFDPGDLVTLVGSARDLAVAVALLGERSDVRIDLDRHVLDFRRMFVSRPDATERPLARLRIPERFGAILTRVRRGDVELVPDGATELELGDRVRVLAPRERMAELAAFFGDSYKALAEIDVITFGVGAALGLAVGMIPVPLPGGSTFKLGFAGGPLLVGLVLGRLGRTGRLVWTLPYSASLTLRQLGLVLFLAGVGTRSGYAFATTLSHGGLGLFVAGAVVTCLAASTTLFVGRRVLGLPMGTLTGMLAGMHTQPAALAFASQQAQSDAPNVGYAAVFPVATIAKIVLAQVLLLALR
jgi:putative transport protein